MSEPEFWECTPRFFAARQKAWVESQRIGWEQARFTGWLAILPHVSHKRRGLKVTDVFRFEWETKPTASIAPVDQEALLKFQEDAKKIFEKQFGIKFKEPETTSNGNGNH